MAATGGGIRYAPEDPTLPKPWKGLVDGKTGYLYFWNPETNTTQYERPVASFHVNSPATHKPLSSSVQRSPQGHCNNDDGDQFKANNGLSAKITSGSENSQTARSRPDYLQADADIKSNVGPVSYASKGVESGLSAEAYRRKHEIAVSGDNVPAPFTSFEATGFPPELLREVRYLLLEEPNVVRCTTLLWGLHVFGCLYWWTINVRVFQNHPSLVRTSAGGDSVCPLIRIKEEVHHAGFSAPTPIQAQSWPIAMQGRDIVAIAKTGSGKTLGYLIPAFNHLRQRRNNTRLGPTVLVLSPTRELATQIQDEAVKFGKSSKISCTCLYGGAPKGPQLKDLDRGVDVVVATPGRLNDILEMRRISLHQVSYLVLDEADRMLDMGFEPQIRKIVKEVPSRRQTLMYTATWPKEVRKIAADLLVNPVQVNIGNADELVANKSITQYIEVLPQLDKRRRLEQILRSQEPGSKIIIFCSTKKMCDNLAGNLTRQFGAAAIHGDKSQSERDHVLNQFKTGRSPILVATDVAARGLDIKDIRVVVNYDFPTGVEDYVHRIGRTGRAGATGIAYTFFCDQDAKHASDLVKVLEGANQNVPPEIRDMASRGGGFGGPRRWGSGGGGRGGYHDSSYTPRDGGRGGWGMPSSPQGGRGGGYDREHRDRPGSGPFVARDLDPPGNSQYKSFHEKMMGAAKNSNRSRSPPRVSDWAANHGRARSRSRSRSPERFDGAAPLRRSFHESMMGRK